MRRSTASGTIRQPIGDDGPMARPIPESTKTSLHQRLLDRKRERWPALADMQVRFRGRFAYIDGELASGEVLPLCRLRYNDSASLWGFAIYLASRDGYEDSVLPSGLPIGTPQEALDCACGLYLNDPSAWQEEAQPPGS
jgi:hypothetical protein